MYVRTYLYVRTSKMDETFLLQFRDNGSRGFDGKIFTINCRAVCRHNDVEVQGFRRSDLKDGDHVVYRHIYKHGRSKMWKGVVVTASSTAEMTDNPELECSDSESEDTHKARGRTKRKTTQPRSGSPPRKKKRTGQW